MNKAKVWNLARRMLLLSVTVSLVGSTYSVCAQDGGEVEHFTAPEPETPAASAPAKPAEQSHFVTVDQPASKLPAVRPVVKATTSAAAAAAAAAAKARVPNLKTSTTAVSDDLLQEIFALTSKPQTKESMDRIFATERDGAIALEKNELAKALTKFQDMYTLAKEVKYGDGEGRALDRMAYVYLQKGENARAKSLIENAMEVLANSTDKKACGRARVTAAQIYLAQDNPLWALQELDMAMKDFNASGMNDNEESARAMTLAATLAIKVGSPVEAIKFYRGAAIHYGQAGNVAKEVLLRNTAASFLNELGLNTAALEEAQKSVQTARGTKEPALIAAALTEQAGAYYGLCEYNHAKSTLDEVYALQIGAKSTTPLPALAVVDEVYGLTLAALGDTAKARTYLEKAWTIFQHGGPPHLRAINLNALGVLNTMSGKAAQGQEQLRKALDCQSVVTPKNVIYDLYLNQNLAVATYRAGETRSARSEMENALRTLSKMKEPDQRILGEVYCSLGEFCWHLKEIGQADAYLRKAIEIAEKIGDDTTQWRAYANLARLQIALGQPGAQESLASAASHFRSPQAGQFPSAERNQFPSTRDELASDLIYMLISQGQTEQALITAEQLKEEAFLVEWHRQGGEVKHADREIYNDLITERSHLHAFELSTTPDKLQKKWIDWMRRLQLLAVENPELARLISPVPLNLQALVDKAHETQSTVVDYVVSPRNTFIFTIDRSGRISAAKVDVGRDQLQSQVQAVLTAASKSGEEARATEKRLLQTLHNELLPEAVQKLLPTNPDQPVVFVPDNTLFNLPFAALVDQQGRYLVETHTLTTAPAVVSLLEGGPRFGTSDSLVLSAPGEGQTREASEISGLFSPDQVTVIGNNTDLNTLAEEAKTKNTLHFASALSLGDNAVLKSQLPFLSQTEGKPATTGGLFRMSLPSDLVVWSGTSVSGKEAGSTKVFTRGLAYAGARNVLYSLWVANDSNRTGELVEFYKGRKEGLSQAQSLRKAQLLAISKDPSVRAWAAFQLSGLGH